MQKSENVLALTNRTSSDLSSTTFLSIGISSYTQQYREPPAWFFESVNFSSFDIPIVFIHTQGETIVHEPKIMARTGIVHSGTGKRYSIYNLFNEYDGWIGIEYRGNMSFRISD